MLAAWRNLGTRAWVVPREEAIAAGWFGEDAEHLAARIGDVVAAPAGPWAIVVTRAEPHESALVAHDGWLTTADRASAGLTLPEPDELNGCAGAARASARVTVPEKNYEQLPDDLPVTEDDGAAAHLGGAGDALGRLSREIQKRRRPVPARAVRELSKISIRGRASPACRSRTKNECPAPGAVRPSRWASATITRSWPSSGAYVFGLSQPGRRLPGPARGPAGAAAGRRRPILAWCSRDELARPTSAWPGDSGSRSRLTLVRNGGRIEHALYPGLPAQHPRRGSRRLAGADGLSRTASWRMPWRTVLSHQQCGVLTRPSLTGMSKSTRVWTAAPLAYFPATCRGCGSGPGLWLRHGQPDPALERCASHRSEHLGLAWSGAGRWRPRSPSGFLLPPG